MLVLWIVSTCILKIYDIWEYLKVMQKINQWLINQYLLGEGSYFETTRILENAEIVTIMFGYLNKCAMLDISNSKEKSMSLSNMAGNKFV